MMVTLGVYMRRSQRLLRKWASNPRVHILLQGGGYFLTGFLGSAASLGHRLQPIALGFLCAQSGWPAVLTALGSGLGYLLFWGNQGPMGAVWTGLGLAAALLLQTLRLPKKPILLMPAIAGCIVAVTGLLFQYYRLYTPPIDGYLLQIAMAIGAGAVFSAAAQRRDPILDWLMYGLGVLCLAQIMPIPYLSPGFLVMGSIAVAAPFPASALAGLALDLSGITPVPMTAVACLSYFVRLIPRLPAAVKYLNPGLAYFAVMRVCGLWDLMPLPALVLGGIAAWLLPKQTSIPHRRGETGTAQVQLELTASVLQQMETMLLDTEDAPIDEQALIVRAADRACSGCSCRKTCREHPEQISPAILHKPLGNGGDLPPGCRKSGRLLMELRRSQEQLRLIRADRDRRTEYRLAVGQQYRFLSDYLQDVSDQLSQRNTPPKAWFQPRVGVSSAGKTGESGDRCIWFAGVSCRYYVLLCDGMGTGAEAARDAKKMADMLRKLLAAGYPASYALRSVNSLCALQGRAGIVTMDLAELRLDTGRVTLYKWGAPPSFVICQGESIKIGTATPPPGLSVADGRETEEKLSLRRGETLVLLSDGAGGEDSLRRLWTDTDEDVKALAERILQNNRSGSADDATVAVVRLTGTGSST